MKSSVGVLFGYLSIGIAFGLLMAKAGYPVYLALLMSLMIYAGAAQFLAIPFFTSNANLFEIAIAIFLLNSRHIFYGLSFLQKYAQTGWFKPYLIFALTDETYAVLSSTDIPNDIDRTQVYFWISLLDQVYWISGTLLGALGGSLIKVKLEGLDFALTALFIVLLIEQIKTSQQKLPFGIAFGCAMIALLWFGKENLLLIAILASISLFLGTQFFCNGAKEG